MAAPSTNDSLDELTAAAAATSLTTENEGQPSCATCNKPASKCCVGCSEYSTEVVRYCNNECQKADRDTHKPHCLQAEDRKVVTRIGNFAQKAFYILREMLWDNYVDRVTTNERGELLLHHGMLEHVLPYVFFDFPPSTVVGSEERRHALVTICACDAGLDWMHKTLEHLMLKKVAAIEEVTMKVRNRPQASFYGKYGEKDKTDYHHRVLKVETNRNRNFALDLAGAQYGNHDEPVTLWNTYMAEKKAMVENIRVFGSVRTIDWNAVRGHNEYSRMFVLQTEGVHRANTFITSWRNPESKGFAALLKQPKAEFEVAETQILEGMKHVVRGYLNGIHTPLCGPLTRFKGSSISPVMDRELGELGIDMVNMQSKEARMQEIISVAASRRLEYRVAQRPNGYPTYFF